MRGAADFRVSTMRIRFWGVRGSTPTPQPENMRYGGNTPCVEIRSAAGKLLIVDCGSGMRMLGRALEHEFGRRSIRAHILISHYHWDHIQGIPFFTPLYRKKNEFHFHALRAPGGRMQRALRGQMKDPYFPVDMGAMLARRTFEQIYVKEFDCGGFRVRARRVNHPQGCLAFRIECDGKAVVYATDNEPGHPRADRYLRELARGADALIYDSQYTRRQLRRERKGWGHSSWEEGVAICEEAGVNRFFLFHFDPDCGDRTVARLARRARRSFPRSRAAFEGMEVRL